MSEPAFSVVIPAYNAPRTVGPAVKSVLGQGWEDLELIVVDDGSTDATPERVEALASDPRVTLIRQRNQGVAAARNTGIAHAHGRYVSFLDNDDLWMPNYLETVRETFQAHAEAGLVYTDAWSLDDTTGKILRETAMGRYQPAREPPLDPGRFLELLVVDNFILSSATVPRSVLEQLGGFDTSLTGVDDYDLWLRILLTGHQAVRAPGLLVIQRHSPRSQSSDDLMMTAQLRAVLAGIAERPEVPPRAEATLRRRVDALDRYLEAAGGGRPLLRAAWRLRMLLGAVRLRLVGGRNSYDEPPPEIAAAFPDFADAAATPAARAR